MLFMRPTPTLDPQFSGRRRPPRSRRTRSLSVLLLLTGVSLVIAAIPAAGATPPAHHRGVLRAGTTNLNNTSAYPNTPIIPGPLPIPPGGVQVPAGADIQTYINNNPAGTQFNLAAGTYSG